jgi:L-lysine exporter family protein LysE/ArgO
MLSVIGLSAVLARFPSIGHGLWIGGTIVLLYFTYAMIRSSIKEKHLDLSTPSKQKASSSLSKDFFWGLGLALASPTSIVWFAAIGGPIMASSPHDEYGALLLFFCGFFSACIVWSLGIAIISHQGGKVLGPKLVRGFSIASALLFFYFAVKVFLHGWLQWNA